MSDAPRNVLHQVTGSKSEPVANDLPTLVLVVVLGLCFAGQFFGRINALDFAVSMDAVRAGRWWTLVSHMFVHGGLFHILFNLSALMSVGGIVSWRLGRTVRAWASYYLLFLLTGVIGGLGFLAAHPFGGVPAVGASGAICGLIGVVARITPHGGPLAPVWSRQVLDATLYLLRWNVILVAIFWVLGRLTGATSGGIAWECHLAGYAAGLFLAPLFMKLAGAPVLAAPPPPEPPPPAASGPWG